MAKLKDMVPPGEAIRWGAFRSRKAMEIAVTGLHVIWAGRGVFDRDKGQVPLVDIQFVDLEEGGNSVNLYCDDAIYRIEEIKPGTLEELASAIGRPARIWRKCTTPAAILARRWRLHCGAVVAGLSGAGLFGLASLVLGKDFLTRFDGVVAAAFIVVPGYYIMEIAKNTLPHLLLGHTLLGGERRDFVGWMIDLRWRGVKPSGSGDERSLRSRLGDWAMCKAYGHVPDIGEREPEILVPGEFPERS